MSGHAVPFFCPYCGEEDIEPVGEHGGWSCAACTKSFVLKSGLPAANAGTAPSPVPSGSQIQEVRR